VSKGNPTIRVKTSSDNTLRTGRTRGPFILVSSGNTITIAGDLVNVDLTAYLHTNKSDVHDLKKQIDAMARGKWLAALESMITALTCLRDKSSNWLDNESEVDAVEDTLAIFAESALASNDAAKCELAVKGYVELSDWFQIHGSEVYAHRVDAALHNVMRISQQQKQLKYSATVHHRWGIKFQQFGLIHQSVNRLKIAHELCRDLGDDSLQAASLADTTFGLAILGSSPDVNLNEARRLAINANDPARLLTVQMAEASSARSFGRAHESLEILSKAALVFPVFSHQVTPLWQAQWHRYNAISAFQIGAEACGERDLMIAQVIAEKYCFWHEIRKVAAIRELLARGCDDFRSAEVTIEVQE